MTKREKLLERINNIFKQTQVVIDSMKIGDRLQLKEMAQAVGIALSSEPKVVATYVSDYAHNSDEGYVTRGKKGGYIKGVKPLKAPKAPVTSNVSSNTSSESVGVNNE